jgi:vancomycin resistance protein YoaR
MKPKKFFTSISLFVFLIIILFVLFSIYQQRFGGKVITDLWADDTNLKGMTREQIRPILEKKVSQIEASGIKIYNQQKQITVYPIIIAVSDPDLTHRLVTFNVEQTIDNIFFAPQKMNPLGFLKPDEKQKISLAINVDRQELFVVLKSSFQQFETPARDAFIQYDENGWGIGEEKDGLGFDYEETMNLLTQKVENFDTSSIELKEIVTKPSIRKQDAELSANEVEEISKNAPITLFYGENQWQISKKELQGWIAFKKENNRVRADLDMEKIKIFLTKIAEKIDQPIQEAKFKMENEKVVEFQLAKEGRILDLETSANKIKQYIASGVKEIGLEVALQEPNFLNQEINQMGIKELVGLGESNFKGSPKNRIHNIGVGSKILNGVLIKPGEEFSLLKTLGDVSADNGYLPELVIKGDRTIPELGGGLCQIATTSFRVALNAGLPITERRPHAFRVVYYEPAGMDATIYSPSPDFKFINDYSSWLLLQTKIEGTKLIFELYGTTDGRTVELSEPKLSNLTSPGQVQYVETETMAPGTKRLVERATPGADAEFSRTITYFSGEKKEEVWKSHYKSWPEMWLVGKEPSSVPPSGTTEATTTNQSQTQ